MLALKTIHLAGMLKDRGYDVVLAIDNFKNVLNAEWSMLQNLQAAHIGNARYRLGGRSQDSSVKISPISILN